MSWDLHDDVAVAAALRPTRVADATPVSSTAVDLRTLDPGDRLVAILSSFETNVANTGGAWTITESATSGGAQTAATLDADADLAVAADVTTLVTKVVGVKVNPAKPWVTITFTGTDAAAEVDVAAQLVAIPRALVG